MLNALSGSEPSPSTSTLDKLKARVAGKRAEQILGLPYRGDTWFVVVEITPAKAEMLLAAMPAQRAMHRTNLEYFRRLLRAGQFVTTHQGIAFNTRGDLIDGQHRLTACVETGISIVVQATFNLPDDLFASLDRGKTRSLGDDLTVRSHTNGGTEASILQAAIRVLRNLEQGRAPWQSGTGTAPSLAEAEDILARHPHLLETARFAMTHRKPGLPGSALAAFYALFRNIDPVMADGLMIQIVKGENLREGDPAYAFRVFTERFDSTRRHAHRAAAMTALVRAWNAFYEGRRISRIDTGIRGPGEFPAILGLKH